MTAYGFGNWMPTFFLRVAWLASAEISIVYGAITTVFGS